MTERRPIANTTEIPFTARRAPKPFFVLRELPCPYIPGRMERKIITDLSSGQADALNSDLSRGGFRRSHLFAYRPACRGCNACVPVRVDARAHAPTRSQREVWRRNRDLSVALRPPRATDEQYGVFARYLASRHGEGEMADMGPAEYRHMVEETAVTTRLAEFRAPEGALIGGCLVDLLDDGTSAVYSFFDPDQSRRSLGTFAVLWLLAETQRRGGHYVYLGYWVAESRKMLYKSRFHPLEKLTRDGWMRADPAV